MTVMRVHKNGNFTVMSNYHFKEKKMSLKSKGLLSLMLSLPPEWNYTVSGLVSLSKDGRDSVMTALAELEKFGYLHRERVKDDKGQFAGVEYNIYEEPQQKKPIAEKSTLENSTSENPEQLITYELKTKEFNTDSIYILNILDNVRNEYLKNLYVEYLTMRKNMDATVTPTGLKLLIERNEKLSNGDIELQKTMLENAIINCYKNVYLPNDPEVNNDLASKKRDYGL